MVAKLSARQTVSCREQLSYRASGLETPVERAALQAQLTDLSVMRNPQRFARPAERGEQEASAMAVHVNWAASRPCRSIRRKLFMTESLRYVCALSLRRAFRTVVRHVNAVRTLSFGATSQLVIED